MHADTSSIHRLVESWQRESATPMEPALTVAAVNDHFAKHGFAAPKDAVELYTLVGGMPDNYPDNRMFELWNWNRIRNENTSQWEFLWFGDWLISSHLYALKPVDSFHSQVFIDHHCNRQSVSELVADSLYDFAERLLTAPDSVGVIL